MVSEVLNIHAIMSTNCTKCITHLTVLACWCLAVFRACHEVTHVEWLLVNISASGKVTIMSRYPTHI